MVRTVERIVEEALVECSAYYQSPFNVRSVLYDRASLREAQLFDLANARNPGLFAASAIAEVVQGAVNARELLTGTVTVDEGETPPEPAQRIIVVRVEDAGTSPYAYGDEVNIVPLDEPTTSAYPPRVTYASGVFSQVGTDLDGVAKLRFHYSRRPQPMRLASDPVSLPEPYSRLLVYDLAKFMVRRTVAVPLDVRTFVMGMFGELEKELTEQFVAYVDGFVSMAARH